MTQPQTVLGLVGRAATWPHRVEAWSVAGAFPVRVSYCGSVAHLQARLAAGHDVRVVLLDGDLPVVDRDLLADITAIGGAPVVVDGTRRRQRWAALGAAASLPSGFDRVQLLATVADVRPAPGSVPAPTEASPAAPLVAVTGPGGTGTSVAAIAVAQGVAADRRRVLLIDCCLHAEQAMLHNAHGGHPGLVDLVELHARCTPEHRVVRQFALGVVERGYHLLPGLDRARQWPRVRPESLEVTLDALRGAFETVVADVDADVEGEAESGSIEVEERNALARTVLAGADVTLVVGRPQMKGVYALVRTIVDLLEFGVDPRRLVPVITMAPAARTVRSEVAGAVRHLVDALPSGRAVEPVLFAPEVAVEDPLRERDALPAAWASLLAGAVTATLDRAGRRAADRGPTRVPVGSLGHWDDPPEMPQ